MTRLLTLAIVVGLSVGCGGGDATPTSSPTSDAAPAADSGSGEKPADDGSGKKEGSGTTEVNFNLGNLPTLALAVPDIECEGCAASVSTTLAEVEGVEDVTVDVETRVATVAIDESAFDSDAAIKALDEASFPKATVVTNEAAPADAG